MKGELINMSYDFRDLDAFHGVMVFCEQRQGNLMPTDFELVSEARKLADALGLEVIEEGELPFWDNGVKYFTVLGPNREKVEFNQYL